MNRIFTTVPCDNCKANEYEVIYFRDITITICNKCKYNCIITKDGTKQLIAHEEIE